MLLMLALTAWADPTVEVAAGRSFTLADDLDSGSMVSIAAGARPWTHIGLEGRIDGQLLSAGSARLQAMPAVRLHVFDPEIQRSRWRPSVVAGAGGALSDDLIPLVMLGVDLDIPTGWPHHLRAGAATWTDLSGGWMLGFRLGVLGRPGRHRHEPMVAPSSEVPPQGPSAAPHEGAE